jgi:hypothetical protein
VVNPHLDSKPLKFAGRLEYTIYTPYKPRETIPTIIDFMYIDIQNIGMTGGQPTPRF